MPGYRLWYAVRGFFDNGGGVCYVVRASNGTYGSLTLPDRTTAANDVIEVRARQPGDQPIKVAVAGTNPLTATDTGLYRPTGSLASITGREITMGADGATLAETVAARFRPGDWITVGSGGERVQVVRVSGAGLRLGADLAGSYTPGTDTVRLADAPAGQQTVRLQYAPGGTWGPVPIGSLTQGTVLTLDPTGLGEAHVIETVQAEYLPEGVDLSGDLPRRPLRAGQPRHCRDGPDGGFRSHGRPRGEQPDVCDPVGRLGSRALLRQAGQRRCRRPGHGVAGGAAPGGSPAPQPPGGSRFHAA